VRIRAQHYSFLAKEKASFAFQFVVNQINLTVAEFDKLFILYLTRF